MSISKNEKLNFHWAAIWVIAKRELLQFWRNKTRVISSIAQGFMLLIIFTFGFSSFRFDVGGTEIPTQAFIASGMITLAILFGGIFGGLSLIRDKLFGFLKEMLVSPIKRSEIMIGKTLGVGLQSVIGGIIIMLISISIGSFPLELFLIIRVILVIPVFLILSIGLVGIGLVIASKMSDFQGFGLVQTFLIMPMMWLSGAIFPWSSVPVPMQVIMAINPVFYGVEAVRFILTGVANIPIYVSLLVISVFSAILIYLGGRSFTKIEAS